MMAWAAPLTMVRRGFILPFVIAALACTSLPGRAQVDQVAKLQERAAIVELQDRIARLEKRVAEPETRAADQVQMWWFLLFLLLIGLGWLAKSSRDSRLRKEVEELKVENSLGALLKDLKKDPGTVTDLIVKLAEADGPTKRLDGVAMRLEQIAGQLEAISNRLNATKL